MAATDLEIAATDLISIIDQFQAPVVKDSKSVLPTFEETPPLPSVEGVPPTLVQNVPLLAKRSLAAMKQISLAEEEDLDQPNPIRDEYFEAIRKASRIPNSALLETFNPYHMECASALISIFYKIPLNNLKRPIQYAKTQINPHLLNYALSVALRHRKDTTEANIQIPSHVCTSPQMYVDINIANDQFHGDKLQQNSTSKDPIYIDINTAFTATDMDAEHRVAYFREDIGVNLHHRHWHEVYPFIGGKEIVKKDRRGELFYYMHQQMLARYNFERLSNNLPKTEPYSDVREPIKEAYFPKLDTAAKSKLWCPRQANAKLQDLKRETFFCRLSDLERWRDRLYDAIDRGYAIVKNDDGTETLKKLVEPEAINDLGNSIESVPALSWNSAYYGDIHNKGHLFISYCHDPDKRFNEDGSVMSHSETAVRDPIFYRWHAYIDDIFQHYKSTLKSYTYEERFFPGIEIKEVKVKSQNVQKENRFKTFWQKDAVDITQGILNRDPQKDGRVFAVFSHLQHENFVYNITVNNTNSVSHVATVRIFIAPKCDESGNEMVFNKQRRFFIELDKFNTTLTPGTNQIERKSAESSVTIPFEQSFMTTNDAKEYVENVELRKTMLSYCGCGWPQHLLIGKGNAAGFQCVLFVMITDYEKDKVEDKDNPIQERECCVKSAVSFCGLRDKKYPDSRPMGFPFDRNIGDAEAKLGDFLTKSQLPPKKTKDGKPDPKVKIEEPLSNMKVVDVDVRFFEETREGPSLIK